MSQFRPVTSAADLDAVWRASELEPVILFKHSQSCGVSLMAHDLLDEDALPWPVHEIVIQRHRDLSNRVAEVLGVRHESPQVFVVARGRAVWHSSHAGVRGDRLRMAFADAAATFPAPTRGDAR